MTQDAKNTIRSYLAGARDYAEGAALYNALGHNLMLKRRFRAERGPRMHALLVEELRKLAGITPGELGRMVAPAPEPKPEPRRAPEEISKAIRFRERFPFLNSPDCPDSLKILVADLFTSHSAYCESYARLQAAPDGENMAEDARLTVENYLVNREIWDELEYYKNNGQVLGRARYFRERGNEVNLADVADAELAANLRNARSNVSKSRRKASENPDDEKAAEALARWENTKARLEAEIERRKKK